MSSNPDKILIDSARLNIREHRGESKYVIDIKGTIAKEYRLPPGETINMDFYGEDLSVLPTEARSAIALFLPIGLSSSQHNLPEGERCARENPVLPVEIKDTSDPPPAANTVEPGQGEGIEMQALLKENSQDGEQGDPDTAINADVEVP